MFQFKCCPKYSLNLPKVQFLKHSNSRGFRNVQAATVLFPPISSSVLHHWEVQRISVFRPISRHFLHTTPIAPAMNTARTARPASTPNTNFGAKTEEEKDSRLNSKDMLYVALHLTFWGTVVVGIVGTFYFTCVADLEAEYAEEKAKREEQLQLLLMEAKEKKRLRDEQKLEQEAMRMAEELGRKEQAMQKMEESSKRPRMQR